MRKEGSVAKTPSGEVVLPVGEPEVDFEKRRLKIQQGERAHNLSSEIRRILLQANGDYKRYLLLLNRNLPNLLMVNDFSEKEVDDMAEAIWLENKFGFDEYQD